MLDRNNNSDNVTIKEQNIQSETTKAEKNENHHRRKDRSADNRRRIGTMTMGVTLIIVGILLLFFMIKPFDLSFIIKLSPALLILLGVEMLWQYFSNHGKNLRYDFGGTLFCFLIITASLGLSAFYPIYMEHGPASWTVEQQLENQIYDSIYTKVPGDIPVASLEVNSQLISASPQTESFDRSELTDLDHVGLSFTLNKTDSLESFAQTVRQLADIALEEGLPRFSLEVCAPNGDGEYSIYLRDRFALDFTVDEIISHTEQEYSREYYERIEEAEETAENTVGLS